MGRRSKPVVIECPKKIEIPSVDIEDDEIRIRRAKNIEVG